MSKDTFTDSHGHGSSKRARLDHLHILRIFVPIVVSGLTALCLGYDMGMMSGAVGPISHHFKLNPWEQGISVGCLNLVAAGGTLFGSWTVDQWGRVYGVKLTAFLLLMGPLIVASSQLFATLLLGRLVTGVGGGLALVTAPIYASELAPPQHRGLIVSSVEVSTNIGVLMGYFAAMLMTASNLNVDVGWRIVSGLAAVPAAFALMQSGLLMESPRWLLKVGRRTEAIQALAKLTANHKEQELLLAVAKMEDAIRTEQQQASWAEVLCPSAVVFRMLLAGVGCAFFQQAVGVEAFIYNTPRVLKQLGLVAVDQRNLATMFVGVVPILGALCGALCFDMVGRRAGLLLSLGLTTSCLGGLWALQSFGAGLTITSVVLLCLLCFAVDMGLAPGMLVIGTESYPVAIRAKALALGLFTNRLLSGVTTLAFPVLWHHIGLNGLLLTFSAISAVGMLWAWICVPEATGLALEDAAKLYQAPIRRNSLRTKDIEECDSATEAPKGSSKAYGATSTTATQGDKTS